LIDKAHRHDRRGVRRLFGSSSYFHHVLHEDDGATARRGNFEQCSFLTYALVVPLAAYNTPEDAENCPIGAAAWVDFPEIDCIDELRARLRL
jgi:hypothetical protein